MKNRKPIIIAAIIVVCIILGVLIRQFGNVGVRRSASDQEALVVSNPLIAGVPSTVRWQVAGEDRSVLLVARLETGEFELESSRLNWNEASITVPCEAGGGGGSLRLVELLSGKTLAQAEIRVLPPGPDCF